MEEEEGVLNNPNQENQVDKLFNRFEDVMKGKKSSGNTTGASANITYDTGIGSSQYDKGLISSIQLDPTDFGKSLQEYRARKQPISHQFANGLVKLVPNIALGTVGTIASALDFEDYWNSDQEVGNWLTNYTKELQDSLNDEFKIYRENPNKPLDLDDSGWWTDNLFSLGESVGSFAIGGMGLAKGITLLGNGIKSALLLSKSARAAKLVNTMTKTQKGLNTLEGLQTVSNAGMLNQAEGILEAMDVQKEIYEKYVDELGEQGAKRRASEAATAVIAANRANILLNLSSANLFFKVGKYSRRAPQLDTFKKSVGRAALEGGQESAEEIINMLASNYGKSVGNKEDYTYDDVMNDIGSLEAAEAAILGFLGGMGQTVLTKEVANRFMKTGDPDNPGQKISIKDYNKKQYEKYQEHVKDIKSIDIEQSLINQANQLKINKSIVDLDERAANYREQGKVEEAKKAEEEATKLREAGVHNQAFDSFQKGTANHLTEYYREIANGEQKEGYPDNYKELANKRIQTITELESIYNKSMGYDNGFGVYMNRAGAKNIKDNLSTYKSELTLKEAKLHEEIERVTDGTGFSVEDRGYMFFEEKNDTPEFNKVADAIKESEEYADYLEAKIEVTKANAQINFLNKQYKKLTSPKHQAKVKKQKEARETSIKKKLDELSEKVEKETIEDIKDNAKAKKVKEQEEKELELFKQKEKAELARQRSYDNIINNYAVGEQIPMPTDQNPDQDAVLTEVDEKKGVVILTLFDNSQMVLHKNDPDKVEIHTESDIENSYSTEGGDSSPIAKQDVENKTGSGKEDGAKVISRFDEGDPLTWVAEQYPEFLEYEREPRDKRNDKVGFRINTQNVNKLSPIRIEAFKLFKQLENSGKLKDLQEGSEEYNLLVDHLSILAEFPGEILAPFEAMPNRDNTTEGERAIENFNDYSRPLRKQIIDALIAGVNISEINTTVKDQFKGLLKVDKMEDGTVPENNILDLYGIKDMSDVHLYMVDHLGNLVDIEGNKKEKNISGLGEIYMDIPMANGEIFSLKLNVRKINSTEADVLYRLYELQLNQKDISQSTPLSELDKADYKFVVEEMKEILDVMTKTKPMRDITVQNVIDFLIWDKSSSPKSMVKMQDGKLLFGNNTILRESLGDPKNKEMFVDFLVNNKRRHIRVKNKKKDKGDVLNLSFTNPNYVEYLIKSKVLNTNAIVGEPAFQGRTHIYLTPEVTYPGKEEVKKSKVKAKIKEAATKGQSTEDIEQQIQKEMAPILEAEIKKIQKENPKLKKFQVMIQANKAITKKEQALRDKLIGKIETAPTEEVIEEVKETEEKPLISEEKDVSLQKEKKDVDKSLTEGLKNTGKSKRSKRSNRKNKGDSKNPDTKC